MFNKRRGMPGIPEIDSESVEARSSSLHMSKGSEGKYLRGPVCYETYVLVRPSEGNKTPNVQELYHTTTTI